MGKYQPMIERIMQEEERSTGPHLPGPGGERISAARALSRAKAKGMWQFISSRGKEYGLRQTWWIDERSDPGKVDASGGTAPQDLYEQFNDWYLAMAAYNAGPNRITRAIARAGGAANFWVLADKRLLPRETINYVRISWP